MGGLCILFRIMVGAVQERETTASFLIHVDGLFPPQSYGSSLKILQRSFARLITINISSLLSRAQPLPVG